MSSKQAGEDDARLADPARASVETADAREEPGAIRDIVSPAGQPLDREVLQAILNTLEVGVGISDPAGNFLLLNAAGLRLHGFASLGEVLEPLDRCEADIELRYPDGRQMPLEEWPTRRAARGEFVRNVEVILVRRGDQSTRHVNYTVTPIRDAAGTVVLHLFTMMDIAARREAERALVESEERLRIFIDHVPAPIQGYRADGTVVSWNRASERLFGYRAEEALGRDLGTLIIPPELLDRFREGAASGGEATESGEFYPAVDVELRRKDGERVSVHAEHTAVCRPDSPPTLFCLDIDITARVNAEKIAERRRELLEGIFDHIPVLLVVWEPALQRFTLNRHATDVMGWTNADANAGDLMTKVYPDPAYRAWVASYMQSLQPGWREWSVTTKSGRQIPTEWANIKLSDDTMIGIGVDLRARRRAEAALRQFAHTLELRVAERTAELAESERKFRDLVENSLDVVCEVDPRGILRYVAPQAANYGFDPAALEGHSFLVVVDPEDRDRIANDFSRTLSDGRGHDSEFRILTPGGRRYWVEDRTTVQRDAGGAITGLTTVLREITGRKAAEAREHAAMERLRAFEAAVNQGPAVVMRWRVAPGEWPVEMVSANVRQFGYEPDDLTSGRVSWTGITHPDDAPRLEREVGALLERGEQQFHMEYRLIDASGNVRYVEDWNVVITDVAGNPTHIQAVIMDVTQVRAERQRSRESEERYRRLFEAESDAILLVDAETRRIVDVNEAAVNMYGYTREEFRSITHWDLTTEPDATADAFRRNAEGDLSRIPLRWHRRKDGTVFPVEVSPGRFMLDGRIVLCGIMRDITERVEAQRVRDVQQERLRQLAAKLVAAQDDEQRRIAEGLHDDVAQILAACNVKLSVAEKTRDPEQARAIRKEVENLVRDAATKVRSLSFELSASTLYHLGLREALSELCNSMTARYGMRCELVGDDESPALDEETATVLFKAARELIFNVVKYAGIQSATVTLMRDDDMVRLSVEDQGTGFPEGVNTDEPDAERGLGLFGIRQRVADLGGRMEIDSRPGVLTRVSLWVPERGRSPRGAAPAESI